MALHEHHVDDIRIDPTQVKADNESEKLCLPQRKASYESDGIRPSEVAKDHFFTAEERQVYARQLAEEHKILVAQQKSYTQRKTQHSVVSNIVENSKSEVSSATVCSANIIEKEETLVEGRNNKGAIENPKDLIISDSKIKVEKVKFNEVAEVQQIELNSSEEKSLRLGRKVESYTENVKGRKEQEQIQIKSPKGDPGKGTGITLPESRIATAVPALPVALADSKQEESAKPSIDTKLTASASASASNPSHTHRSFESHRLKNVQLDTEMLNNETSQKSSSSNNNNTASDANQSAANRSTSQSQRLNVVSVYNFGNDRGAAGGQPPNNNNINIFLVPTHLITYETSIEVNFRRIPFPQPPPPPRFVKKLLVHTESLERKTRAFLSGNFELGTTDSSIRTARQKIRSLKSTILKSDDEVKHASDTITKAQSGEFLKIFAPPIVEKPLYEFIEIPSERSEEECSEYSDRRSERGISEQHENMEDYYSSKYSSRSSRKRVEGKTCHYLPIIIEFLPS